MKTHYEILGVSRGATASQIKTCYRKLVKLYHPDKAHLVHPDADNRIREINAAYSVLSKPLSRASYDAKLNKDVFQITAEPEHCANCGKPTTYWCTSRAARLCIICTGSDANP
jgi:DnaJ-class molecular chaperone